MTPRSSILWLTTAFLTLLTLTTVRAQDALYVEHNGQLRLVHNVERHRPYIEDEKGKLIEASGSRYSLQHVPEYMPVYVSIRHLKVETQSIELVDTGSEINREFRFRAEFESAYPLERVFIVLDLNTEDAGKGLFLQEIGRLSPRDPKPIDITIPLSQGLGAGHYHIHLFVDGSEVFHSEMPFEQIERTLDRMVTRRVANVVDAPPKLFVGPPPEYPAKLRKAKVGGQAVIHFTISPTGRVLDPTVKSATDPALGEAALAAARQWRFLPKMKAGLPVATSADLPFNFGGGATANGH